MKIIGISGASGSGKDTAYQLLKSYLESEGLKCVQLSFAEKLKDACTLLFGWDRSRLQTDVAYKEGSTLDDGSPDPACVMLGMSRREVMQKIGTEAMRKGLHEDVWIIVLKLAIMDGHFDGFDFGFITDCRFQNELKLVRDMGGTLIQVQREGDSGTLTQHTTHASEQEWRKWTDWDHIITNRINHNMLPEDNLSFFRRELIETLQSDLGLENHKVAAQ